MTKHLQYIFISLIATLLCVSCLSGVDSAIGQQTEVQTRAAAWMPGRVVTRADISTIPAPATVQPEEIGVFAYQGANTEYNEEITAGVVLNNERMVYASVGGDHYPHYEPTSANPPLWRNTTYHLYAYAPYEAGAGITMPEMTDFHWGTSGAPLVVDDVDRLVARAPVTHKPITDKQCAQFIGEKPLDHIYAALQFAFKLHDDYARLRYLHIRSVSVSNWTDDSSIGTLEQETCYIRTSDYTPYGCLYVQPATNEAVGTFTISITYDVYDLTDQITRQNVVTTASMQFVDANLTTYVDNQGKLVNEGGKKGFAAGYYYNVLISIVPDFLYVLSDNDQSADIILRDE